VSQVMDSAITMLMKDNRVAMLAPELRRELLHKLRWIRELPDFIWVALADVAGLHPEELRAKCVRATHRGWAFYYWRVFTPVYQLPWSLCRGDVRANLEALSRGPRPLNRTAAKAWDLMDLGLIPMAILVRMVVLFADTPWTTMVVEQLHGTLAALSRLHPEYELDTLLARTMIMYTMKLLPCPSKVDKEISAVVRKVSRVERRSPGKASGRQQYFKDLSDKAKSKTAHQTKRKANEVRKQIMKKHGALWTEKSSSFVATYGRIAKARASGRHHELVSKR